MISKCKVIMTSQNDISNKCVTSAACCRRSFLDSSWLTTYPLAKSQGTSLLYRPPEALRPMLQKHEERHDNHVEVKHPWPSRSSERVEPKEPDKISKHRSTHTHTHKKTSLPSGLGYPRLLYLNFVVLSLIKFQNTHSRTHTHPYTSQTHTHNTHTKNN